MAADPARSRTPATNPASKFIQPSISSLRNPAKHTRHVSLPQKPSRTLTPPETGKPAVSDQSSTSKPFKASTLLSTTPAAGNTPTVKTPSTRPSGLRPVGPSKTIKQRSTTLAPVSVNQSPAAPPSTSKPTPLKPSFSVTQREFTPRKPAAHAGAVIPVKAEYSIAQKPTTPAQRDAYDMRLELMHVHLLHKAAKVTQTQWHASAHSSFKAHFDSLVTQDTALKEQAKQLAQQQNAAANLAWLSTDSKGEHNQNFRILSKVLQNVEEITGPLGTYTKLMSNFEHWYDAMTRSHFTGFDSGDYLGESWKTSLSSVRESLVVNGELVSMLPEPLAPSDLARCLVALRTYILGLLDELDVIEEVEMRMARKKKRLWDEDIAAMTRAVDGL